MHHPYVGGRLVARTIDAGPWRWRNTNLQPAAPADASVWIYQFMKARRGADGEMLPNAHLTGFFQRICRLLFHRIRPVFVFDGGVPALKKRTLIARRRCVLA